MAKCEICGKSVTFGIKVSHSHRRSNRTYKPNVKKVKAIVNGTPCRVNAFPPAAIISFFTASAAASFPA